MKANKEMEVMLTVERLQELLDYDPETGVFVWKVNRGKAKVGSLAGYIDSDGYIEIRVDRKLYFAHRLAWLYVTGGWPKDPGNNRFSNLRPADNSLNQQNQRGPCRNNKSGFLGVSYYRGSKKKPWRAGIEVAGKKEYLGLFATAEEAHAAYLRAKRQFHEGCPI